MKRLTKKEIGIISERIKAGVSLNKLASSFNLAKSTLYHYYKKIKGKRYKSPQYSINFSEAEGEIVGIFAGDGSQYYYKPSGNYQTNIHFGNNLQYVNYVKILYESYFNKEWYKFREVSKDKSVKYRLRAVNKNTYDYFSNYLIYNKSHKHDTVKLKKINFSNAFKIGFLRGLVDTDGTVCNYNNRVRISYYSTSKSLIKQIYKFLQELNIQSNIYKIKSKLDYKDIYHCQIFQNDTNKFIKKIRPFKALKLGV